MKAFIYGLTLQLKIDIRSKTMLITCYIVPFLFFAFMGGIFTSINPESKFTLIQSMTIFVISMGAIIGLPPSIAEIYASDIKKMYKANGVPLYLGVVTQFLSAFIHLNIMSLILFVVAPFAFQATVPPNLPLYFSVLNLFIAVSLSVGSVLGLLCKSQSKLTMVSQIIFLPSIMVSGIMFPSSMLPNFLQQIRFLLPSTLGYEAMIHFQYWHIYSLLGMFIAMIGINAILLNKISK